jgi:type IV secretion system protein VirB9
MNFIFNILIFLLLTFSGINSKAAEMGLYSNPKAKKEPSFQRLVVEPRQMGHDPRFKSIPFTPNTTVKLTFVYDNQSYVELEAGENVVGIMNPKGVSWQITINGQRIFVKPIESNADTQITVMTDKRTYFWEVYAKEPDGNFDKDYTFYYKYQYPTEEDGKTIRTYAKSILPDIERSPWKYNFNYTITGEDNLYPVKIFDDGEFTYFEFPKSARIPAIFSVDSNGFESIINFRMVGDYFIAEEVSDKFTLRNGADIVCVFNENSYKPKNGKRRKSSELKEYNPNIDSYNNGDRSSSEELFQYQQ